MIEMLKRHEIQILRGAGHTWAEVRTLRARVSRAAGRRLRLSSERPIFSAERSGSTKCCDRSVPKNIPTYTSK
jgi:hypothetical protein